MNVITYWQIALAYGLTGATFVLLDAIWLNFSARKLYRPQLGDVLAERIRVVPAILFYVLYIGGLTLFVVVPAVTHYDGEQACIAGAMFGFFTYMTYDLTNYATLNKWTAKLVILDIAWGTLLSAVVALTVYTILSWLHVQPTCIGDCYF